MVSSKKSSTETNTKQPGTSKPKSKPTTKNKNTRKSDKNDSKNKKHAINGTAKQTPTLVSSDSDSDDNATEDKAETTSKKFNIFKSKTTKRTHGKHDDEDDDAAEEKIHKFPMHRIKKIMRDEDSDLRVNYEALFLVNKASEMFLVQFCKDAYACCAQDRKKALAYKHLSSVVCKKKRYDFLSDFVPEKLKLEDALKEREMAETGKGQGS